MKLLYDTVLVGHFVDRPNRFVVHIELNGAVVAAHLPNPGCMWELLFKGVKIYVVPHGGKELRTAYRVIGIERDGVPIMLDTNYSNEVAEYLINEQQIQGWEDWRVIRREYTVGRSRFDLLLGRRNLVAEIRSKVGTGKNINEVIAQTAKEDLFLLEVKSCTLFSKKGAMFPDAVTERGRKHLIHLKDLQAEGYHTGVLFMVQWEHARWFLPDFHTDLAFAQTFAEVAPFLDWKAVSLRWHTDFCMPEVIGQCHYNPKALEKEAHDAGDYMIVMELKEPLDLEIGSKGMMHFEPAFYIYVGSAKANLAKRIERHKRKQKKTHWHLDYFRPYCEMVATLPFRTSADLECKIAQQVKKIAQWEIKDFGSSDCNCASHLFAMLDNPVHNKAFMDLVEDFRMNRLDRIAVK